MYKRSWIVAIIFSMLFAACIGRLAWLQLLPYSSAAAWRGAALHGRGGWSGHALHQRQRSLVLDTGRGDFVDRYGRPITGETYQSAALFPVREDARGTKEELAKLAAILGVSDEELAAHWNDLREGEFWRKAGERSPIRLTDEQAEAIGSLAVEGVRVLPYRNRYLNRFEAKHAIGFTSEHPEWLMRQHGEELASGKRKWNEQVGGAGLERSLNELLRGIGETYVSYYIDGRYAPMHGLDLRKRGGGNHYYPLQAVTTIDLDLQNAIEAYVDKEGLQEGAVVVLDASNADIVAMVSRPTMNIGRFQSSDGSEWANYAIRAVEPGSIFKLITGAAAIEHQAVVSEEQFICSGEYERYGLSCWKEGGHGVITLEEGLAQSCNIVFATIAERLKPSELLRTADQLGVGHRAGWHSERAFGPFRSPLRLLPEEEAGRLYAPSIGREAMLAAVDGGVLAQSGIGQRDVRMSPLQAANLVVTLLNGGRAMEPRLVSEIRYADGKRMAELPAHRAQTLDGRIRPSTAAALLRGMSAAVDRGTGRSIRQGAWAVAGKSGTAETIAAGAVRNHQWFAGYGPVKSPRYAVAVLAANRPPGSAHQATKLFRGVMDTIAAKDNKKPYSAAAERKRQ